MRCAGLLHFFIPMLLLTPTLKAQVRFDTLLNIGTQQLIHTVIPVDGHQANSYFIIHYGDHPADTIFSETDDHRVLEVGNCRFKFMQDREELWILFSEIEENKLGEHGAYRSKTTRLLVWDVDQRHLSLDQVLGYSYTETYSDINNDQASTQTTRCEFRSEFVQASNGKIDIHVTTDSCVLEVGGKKKIVPWQTCQRCDHQPESIKYYHNGSVYRREER